MATDAPNVLFVFTDQQRYDWVGMHPRVPVRTPNLERLADRGVYFTEAVCPSPLCGPSRACLVSGMEYDACGVLDHGSNYPPDQETMYGRLRDEAGYHVMGCGKMDLHKPEFSWGVDGQHCLDEWGFSEGEDSAGKMAVVGCWREHGEPNDPYSAYLEERGLLQDYLDDYEKRLNPGAGTFPSPVPEDAYPDNYIGGVGLDLIEGAPEDRPWFLQVNFAGPHDPWDVTHDMHGWYRGDDAVDFPGPCPVTITDGKTGETHNEIRRNYAAMVENIDRWLGRYREAPRSRSASRYREALRERGEWEETVVVFASDHGEMLGDHGRWQKHMPYHASAGVPMVVAGPGVREGHVSGAPASVLDVHATALDCAGLDTETVDSRTMMPLLTGDTDAHREYAYSGLGGWRLAYDGRYKLVTGFDPEGSDIGGVMDLDADPVLFDRETDPFETTDVADGHPEVVERLHDHVETHRTESGLIDNYYT